MLFVVHDPDAVRKVVCDDGASADQVVFDDGAKAPIRSFLMTAPGRRSGRFS